MPPTELPNYLHEGFDPWTIKMDHIRDILIQHRVKPPTGVVRKQELVDLFIQHIQPIVPHLRKTHSNTSDEGVTKVSRASSTKTAAPPGPKQTIAKPTALLERPASESKPKRKTTASGSKIETTSDTTPDTSRGRKPRRPTTPTAQEIAEPVSKPTRRKVSGDKKKARGENFSDENPFQSGSESERRRRSKSRHSSSGSVTPSSSRSRSSRRKSNDEGRRTLDHDPYYNPQHRPSFSKYMKTPPPPPTYASAERLYSGSPYGSPSKSRTRRTSVSNMPASRALHLMPSQPLSYSQTSQPGRENSDRRKGQEEAHLGPFWLLLSVALLTYGLWYRQSRIDLGFCTPSDIPATDPRGLDPYQQAVAWLSPICIPCPDHATCLTSSSEPLCHPEYILKPHPLSFGKLLPLSPSCVLNKAKEYQSLQLADAVEQMLHRLAGQEECSMHDPDSNPAELLAQQRVSIRDLGAEVESMRDPSISKDDFEQYWQLALQELGRRRDKVTFEAGINEEYLRSLQPRKSLTCWARQALIRWLFQFKVPLLAVAGASIIGLSVYMVLQKRRREAKLIDGLVDDVLEKLSDQAHYSFIDPVLYPEPFLPQIHLRDALLTHTDHHRHYRHHRRNEIWEKVRVIVDQHPNVRVGAQEVKGEPHRVWEWVGASTGVLRGKLSNHGTSAGTTTTTPMTPKKSSHGAHYDLGSSSGSGNWSGGGEGFLGGSSTSSHRGHHQGQESEPMQPTPSLYPILSQDDYPILTRDRSR